jgi:hypothetical protein
VIAPTSSLNLFYYNPSSILQKEALSDTAWLVCNLEDYSSKNDVHSDQEFLWWILPKQLTTEEQVLAQEVL